MKATDATSQCARKQFEAFSEIGASVTMKVEMEEIGSNRMWEQRRRMIRTYVELEMRVEKREGDGCIKQRFEK